MKNNEDAFTTKALSTKENFKTHAQPPGPFTCKFLYVEKAHSRCYDPPRNAMDDKPPQDLATRAFQKRVLDEFAAIRADQSQMRTDLTEIRSEQTHIRAELLDFRDLRNEVRIHGLRLSEL